MLINPKIPQIVAIVCNKEYDVNNILIQLSTKDIFVEEEHHTYTIASTLRPSGQRPASVEATLNWLTAC
jgi:hypothetical protein